MHYGSEPFVPMEPPHDEGCDCEMCFYEARQSGRPDPKPGKRTVLVFEGEEHELFPPDR